LSPATGMYPVELTAEFDGALVERARLSRMTHCLRSHTSVGYHRAIDPWGCHNLSDRRGPLRDEGCCELAGTVESIDGRGVARVLIGPTEEEWFFPTDLLPDGTCEGDVVRLADREGKLIVVGLGDRPVSARSIEDRLSRPLNSKRTEEHDADELRVVAEAGAVTDREAPPAPGRTRPSHQRRW